MYGHPLSFSLTLVTCTTGDIRLQGGSNDQEGRIEICMNGVWGTVCGDSFNFTEASVACRQLGFSRFRMRLTELLCYCVYNHDIT